MVHPEGIENLPAIGSEASRKLEHFSFRAEDAEAFNNRILSAGERMRVIDNAEIKTAAFNLWDLDANHVHVDFAFDGCRLRNGF